MNIRFKNIFSLSALALGFILLLGFILRIIGIKFGLPQAYHNDEWVLVLATKQFFTGDYNPHNFLYPSLLMYIMYGFERIYYLFSSQSVDVSTLYVLCRMTVLLFGMGSIYLTYHLGGRLYNKATGMIAALVLCLSPLHVINSHFATTDVPLTLFILLALIFTLRLAERGDIGSYALTGILFGLTVSIKIPGAIIFFPIVIAHLYSTAKAQNLHYASLLKSELRAWPKHVRNVMVAALTGFLVFSIFKNFQFFAQRILGIIKVELWIKYYDEIILRTNSLAPKLALLTTITVLVLLYTVKIWLPNVRKLLLLIAIAIGTFFITTPYAILDYRAFLHDFLFQMVVSQTSWSGMFANKASGYVTNFLYLKENFGLVLMAFAALGLAFSLARLTIQRCLILVFGVCYYLYIGSWKLMFDRYMVPLLPLIAVLGAFGLAKAIQFLKQRIGSENRAQKIAVSVASSFILIGIPSSLLFRDAVSFDRYLLKTNTKEIAYKWAQNNLSKDAKILREQYAPELELAGFWVKNINFVFNDSVDAAYVRNHRFDYIIVTDKLWKRPAKENGVIMQREAYAKIPQYADLIYDVKPTRENPGPEIRIYKVQPDSLLIPFAEKKCRY